MRYIDTYVHHDHSVGVIVEYVCDTVIPSKDKVFQEHVHKTAMHIASANPADVKVLLEQCSISNPEKKVTELLSELVDTFKENIELARFVRWDTEIGSSDFGNDDPPPEASSAALRAVK